jgi:hypothetical protein
MWGWGARAAVERGGNAFPTVRRAGTVDGSATILDDPAISSPGRTGTGPRRQDRIPAPLFPREETDRTGFQASSTIDIQTRLFGCGTWMGRWSEFGTFVSLARLTQVPTEFRLSDRMWWNRLRNCSVPATIPHMPSSPRSRLSEAPVYTIPEVL